MYTLDKDGKRVYTLKKVVNGEVTKSAHPARFSPDDRYSRCVPFYNSHLSHLSHPSHLRLWVEEDEDGNAKEKEIEKGERQNWSNG
jgi:hypothetical protein